MKALKNILCKYLAKDAYQYRVSSNDWFILASGEKSPEYFDCKLALCQPAVMAVLGSFIHSLLIREIRAIGGLTMGADPIAMSVCQVSHGSNQEVNWFVVRKDSKLHGQRKRIEGNLKPGDKVAVVDDVVTSGASTIQAIEECRKYGLEVVQVIVLIDREQSNGIENVCKAAGASSRVDVIFKKSVIVEEWKRQQQENASLSKLDIL